MGRKPIPIFTRTNMYCFSEVLVFKRHDNRTEKALSTSAGDWRLDLLDLSSVRLGVNPVLFRLLRMGPLGWFKKVGVLMGFFGMGRVQVARGE